MITFYRTKIEILKADKKVNISVKSILGFLEKIPYTDEPVPLKDEYIAPDSISLSLID